jgi:hypothetical protein
LLLNWHPIGVLDLKQKVTLIRTGLEIDSSFHKVLCIPLPIKLLYIPQVHLYYVLGVFITVIFIYITLLTLYA